MKKAIPVFTIVILVGATCALGYFLWTQNAADSEPTIEAFDIATPERVIAPETPTPTPSPVISAAPQVSPTAEAAPAPAPTAPRLDGSDAHIIENLSALNYGAEVASMLTPEEVARKFVRAVYGLSEGRVVREYRPVVSPKGQFLAKKVGHQTADSQQEVYRIERENDARYASYISMLSLINNEAFIKLYHFYLPTFEEAYQELGVGSGDFHSTLIRAIDVLLDAPVVNEAILLTQPSVMYKFSDPELERLPAAHKLMLRMGTENSEALKLELKKLKAGLSK